MQRGCCGDGDKLLDVGWDGDELLSLCQSV